MVTAATSRTFSGTLTDGLFAYYSFDGSTNDVSGNDRHATADGTIALTTDRFGNADSAYQIEPRGSINVSPQDSLFPYAGSETVTYSLWAKPTSDAIVLSQYLHLNAGASHFFFALDGYAERFTVTGQGTDVFQPAAADFHNQWHHYVVSFDGQNGQVDLWADGAYVGQGTVTLNSSSTSTQPFRMGFLPSAATPPGGEDTMHIDDVAVYNRALTEIERTSLYEAVDPFYSFDVNLQPQADQHGTSTITVTVEDGGLDNDLATSEDNATTSRTFDVTVNPVNDPPTLSTSVPRVFEEMNFLGKSPFVRVNSLATGDFNRDGLDDLAASRWHTPAGFAAWLGRENLNTSNYQLIDIERQGYNVRVADMDGDGDLDAVNVNHNSMVNVYTNNGDGVFSRTHIVSMPHDTSGLALGDFDGDGDIDAAAGTHHRGEWHVLTNPGNGQLAITASYNMSTPEAIEAADFDGDGSIDIAVSNLNQGRVRIYYNNGSGTFGETFELSSGGSFPFHLRSGDVDADGDQDLIVANTVI